MDRGQPAVVAKRRYRTSPATRTNFYWKRQRTTLDIDNDLQFKVRKVLRTPETQVVRKVHVPPFSR